ncbi:MAG: hypothetical protein ABJ287_03865 [Balneola sp.]
MYKKLSFIFYENDLLLMFKISHSHSHKRRAEAFGSLCARLYSILLKLHLTDYPSDGALALCLVKLFLTPSVFPLDKGKDVLNKFLSIEKLQGHPVRQLADQDLCEGWYFFWASGSVV